LFATLRQAAFGQQHIEADSFRHTLWLHGALNNKSRNSP
jgi:hypothetical protein